MFIKYNKKNVHAIGSHDGREHKWLQPGWNEFPDEIWAQYQNDSEIKRMMDDGEIELHDHPDKDAVINLQQSSYSKGEKGKKVKVIEKDQPRYLGEGNREVHLTDLKDEKEAISIIKATFNKKLLQRWTDEETRHKVKRELEAQIKEIDTPGKTKTQAATGRDDR